MSKLGERGEGEIIGLIVLGLMIWGGVALFKHFTKPDYSKPWWTGTETLKVCNVDADKCYSLPATSNGEYVTRVDFPNGGYLTASDSSCHEAASFYNFKHFCSIADQESGRWDIVPLGGNYEAY